MRHEHVNVVGNVLPSLPARLAARQIEAPVPELGLPGRAVEGDALNNAGCVLEVRADDLELGLRRAAQERRGGEIRKNEEMKQARWGA